MTDPGRGPADLAMLDSLTGLWNRRALLAALRERMPTGQGALVLLDLDQFKAIADRIGSDSADRALLDVAGRLLGSLDADPMLCRYAGDAFALLLPDADREKAAAVAETLRAALDREPFAVHDRLGPIPAVLPITASGSVATYPADARSPAALIEAAERAIFVAKRTGRNRIAVAGRLDPAALAEIGIFRGLPCPIFVSRASEQARLRQLAASARETGPVAAVVTGPPGIGKSRLLREFCAWARAERFVVLPSSCLESRALAPYSTLLEQIERHFALDRAQAAAAFERLTPLHRGAIAALSHDVPAQPPLTIEAADRPRVTFEAFAALLAELGKGGAIVAVADEAENADDATLEAYRAAFDKRLPMLVVATTERPWEEFERSPAGEFLRERQPAAARLDLGPLAPEDMRQALSAILPDADVAPDAVEQLVVAANGNPLYLEETVRALLLRGRLHMEKGRWTLPPLAPADVPKDLEGAIRAVAGALPPGANWLLTRAAVIGTRIDQELLQEVLGQREAETLDFIDEARRARLLLPGDGEEDVLSFPASHARRVRLLASDAAERKAIHGRVGVVQEARHGGDAAHLADELTYHYGRAGDDAKARRFDALARKRAALVQPPRSRGARRARLAPVTEALTPAAQEHALAVLRHFAAAVKIQRLYPQWSQVGAQFMTQLHAAIQALFVLSPGLTVAASPAGPTLNGQPSAVVAVADFVALLDDRLVESMTILRGFDAVRLEKVIGAFVAPFDRLRATPDQWDRWLGRENLEDVDLVQKAFDAQRTMVRAAAKHGDKPVPAEELPALRDSMRFLKAAVDNLRLYPPGHPLVEETAVQACRSLIDLVGKVPAITCGTADGELVINGMPADKKFFSDAGAWLAREIDARELKSLSLWQGLGEDEVRALVSALSMPARDLESPEVREALLGQFAHVAIALLKYERSASEASEAELVHPPPKAVRAELRARAHLARAYDRFLSFELEHELPVLVEALTYGAGRPLAEQMVDRLGEHFHDGALGHRRQAFRLAEHAIAYASPGTRQLEVARTAPPLRTRLAQDTGPLHFHAAINLLPIWIPAAVTAGCLRELAEIAGQVLRKRIDAPDTGAEIRKMCEAGLAQIAEARSFDRVLSAVRRANEQDRRAAIEVVMAVGGNARRALVEAMLEEADAGARRTVAAALAPVAEPLAAELGAALAAGAPLERLTRMLEVVDALQSPSLAVPLAALLDHASPAVRGGVMRTAKAGPRAVTLAVARRLIASGRPGDRGAGIEMAGGMRLAEVTAEIGRILEETQDEEEIVRCCGYFAQVPNPVVIGTLAEIARTRPRIFGLVKGYKAPTRAAAVLALAAQKTPQAEEAVARAVADPEVRALAKM